MHSMRALLTLVLLAFVGAVILRSHRGAAQEAPPAEYVGKEKTCGMCHKEEHAASSQTFHAKQKAAPDAAADVKFRHMTGYDADGDKAEQGVSCEACHGPRRATHEGLANGQERHLNQSPEAQGPVGCRRPLRPVPFPGSYGGRHEVSEGLRAGQEAARGVRAGGDGRGRYASATA